jgi:hypothetical protein
VRPSASRLAAALLAGSVALAPAAALGQELAGPPPVELDLTRLAVVGGPAVLLLVTEALARPALSPSHCRWCDPPGFDLATRRALRWNDLRTAGDLSDVLQIGVPAMAALALAIPAWREAGPAQAGEDALVLASAIAVTASLTEVTKTLSARLRPFAWATQDPYGPASAFWSGHTSSTFAAAAALLQVGRLRHRPAPAWLIAAAFAGAAATGYLRIAADRH